MVKTFKRSIVIVAILALSACLVLQQVALYFAGKSAGSSAIASASSGVKVAQREVTGEVNPQSDNYALSAAEENGLEPAVDDIVTVIVKLKDGMLDYANGSGQTVAEAMGDFSGRTLLSELRDEVSAAQSKLSPYVVSYGLRYSTLFNGFSAKVRYRDIAAIEKSGVAERVILAGSYNEPLEITENEVDVDPSTGIFDSTEAGFDGTGTVVAVLDTGTDYTHEVFDMELDPATLALTKDDVAAVADSLVATQMAAANGESINADDLYSTTKLPYGFDYANGDTNVYPFQAHGTHVAGIIGGESERIRGVAPRTQIATFKVFPDSGSGAGDEGIYAALEDAVILGVDAINMSLGSSCGFSREGDDELANEVYDSVNAAGICLVIAAGNEASSANQSTHGNTNLASNPDSGTVGSPASYDAAMAVASISGVKTKYFIADGMQEIYFTESSRVGSTKTNDFVAQLLGDRQSAEYDYVVVPGTGLEGNYSGLDVEGKIAVVRRGGNSFENKVEIAMSRGAAAVVVYNNVSGTISMSLGTRTDLIPACSITMDDSARMIEQRRGRLAFDKSYLAGPFMSDFSSWGVLPNLTLSPDITAHGGEITSSFPGGNEYSTISGTSMACPNLTGALILVREHVKTMENATYTATEARDISYGMMMSTATIVRNPEGNPYSPRKQGAGLVNIYNSTHTQAYLTVDGSNKPKLSLGDDPSRSGRYEMEFNITNLSGKPLSYTIDPIVMTESMSSDNITVAEKAHMFTDSEVTASVKAAKGSAELNGFGLVLGGYAQAKISVTIQLAEKEKDYLEANFRNGMYVEGYIRLSSNNADGIDLSIPYLAFYGDWRDAPMLDVSAYEVGASQADSSVTDEDKLVADQYATLPQAGFINNGEMGYWGMGAFAYVLPSNVAMPITVEEHCSLTTSTEGNYLIPHISAGLFRGAKRVDMEIRDSITGELVWENVAYNARKSYASGEQVGGYVTVNFDASQLPLANNSKYKFTMTCYLDWDGDNDGELDAGNRNRFSFEFTIDNESPVIFHDARVREEERNNIIRRTLELNAYDNHYLQAYTVYTCKGIDDEGNPIDATPITGSLLPVYDGEFNATTTVNVDLTEQWNVVMENEGRLYVEFIDYAKNVTIEEIVLQPGTDVCVNPTRRYQEASSRVFTVAPGRQLELDDYIEVSTNISAAGEKAEYVPDYWVEDLVWESDRPDVAEVRDGLLTALSEGTAKITVRPATPNNVANNFVEFTVNVTAGTASSIPLTGLEFSQTGATLECGESITLSVTPKPYNYNGGELVYEWATTNRNDYKIEVDPEDSSRATITALSTNGLSGVSTTIRVNVRGTVINAQCSIVTEAEYQTEGAYLRSYTGRGDENGVVKIPDDLGVSYIYPYAFMGNSYIKKIIIPEGVLTVMEASIYGCDNLEEVVLPSTTDTIEDFGIAWNPKLKTINLGHVKSIGPRAFIYDTSLEDLDFSSTTFIGDMAFYGCSSVTSIDLTKVGIVGQLAFADCTGISELTVPQGTSLLTQSFYRCTSLKKLVCYSDYIGDAAFVYCSSLTDVTFMNDVDYIGSEAFFNCDALSSVRFLGSLYELGSQAFANCSELTSFHLPAGLSVVGEQPFVATGITEITISKDARLTSLDAGALGAPNLKKFTVEEGNKYLSSDENGVLYDRTMTKLVAYPFALSLSSYKVPDTVVTIGTAAFSSLDYGQGNFRRLTVPSIDFNNVERIEDFAFYGAVIRGMSGFDHIRYIGDAAFANATIPCLPASAATEYIGSYAFYVDPALGAQGVTGLTGTVTIPENVTTIGDYAFRGASIVSLTLNEKLSSFGRGAFAENGRLTSVSLGNSLAEIPAETFANCGSLTRITIPESVKSIGDNAFAGDSALASVNIPEGVTEIPLGAFNGTALRSITIPASVEKIGAYAFGDSKIATFDFKNVTEIGAGAFENSPISRISSASSVKIIGDGAFLNAASLQSANFNSALTVGESAFEGCTALTSFSLASATEIGARAFYGCDKLKSARLDSAKQIGASAFENASTLSGITFPKAESIGSYAFRGTALVSIEIPASLRSLAEGALIGVSGLQEIKAANNPVFTTDNGVLYLNNDDDYTLLVYPEGKTDSGYVVLANTVKIAAYAFGNNKHLTSVTLPVHMRIIGAYAFGGMSALRTLVLECVEAPLLETYLENGVNVYRNFPENISVTVPSNCTGYDNYIWTTFETTLDLRISASGKAQVSQSTLSFIKRVKALPAPAELTLDYASEIRLLERLYNALGTVQQNFVRGGYDNTDYYTILQTASARIAALQGGN